MKFVLLSFAAGLLSACGFAPLGIWPLTLAGLAVLLAAIARAPTIWAALLRGWAFGLGNFVLGLNWIATAFTYQAAMPAWLGWVAVVLLSLYLAIYPALAAGLAWRHGRGNHVPLLLILSAAWIVTEWLRGTMFTGFAWNPIGVALLPTGFSGTARLVGTYGLSALTILVAGIFWLIFERRGRAANAVFAGLAMVSAAGWLAKPALVETRPVPVRIVQPNIGQEERWRPEFERFNMARLTALSRWEAAGPRLLLWPESAVTQPLQIDAPDAGLRQGGINMRRQVAALLAPGETLLAGSIGVAANAEGKVLHATNSVFAIVPGGELIGRYDKSHLVPYGEYLPMRPLLSRLGLSRLAPGDSDFAPGPGPRNLVIPGVGPIGLQICYEIIFSGHVVDDANRPRFLFNPSNDAWFGRWGPPQHLAQAQLRALEEGLPVLRSTPTGISAVIDADGRLLSSIGWRRAGAIEADLPLARAPTIFARGGNILPFALALLLAAIAVALRRRAR